MSVVENKPIVAVVRLPVSWMFFLYYPVTIGVLIFRAIQDPDPPNASGMFFLCIVMMPVSVVFALITSFIYTYRLDERGIRGMSIWGAYKTIQWEDVLEVKRVTGWMRIVYFLIPTTLIIPKTKRGSVYLFTPMVRIVRFQNALERVVPEGSIARKMLL